MCIVTTDDHTEENNSENNSIYFWRIVFTFMIMMLHFNVMGAGWYLAVEFFFIVSGYLVAQDLERYKNPCEWLKKRIKKLYPLYLFGVVECFIASCIMNSRTIKECWQYLLSRFPEILGIQMLGFRTDDFLNMPTWYLQAYLFVGLVIFTLLKINRNLYVYVLGPIAIIGFGGYMFRNFNCLDVWMYPYSYIPVPIMIAFFAMSLGVEVYFINKSCTAEDSRGGYVFRIALEIILFIYITIRTKYYRWIPEDFMIVFMTAVAVMLAFRPHKLRVWCSNILKKFSAMTYSIYINHYFFAGYIFQIWLKDRHSETVIWILYVVVVLLYSMLIYILFEKLGKYITGRFIIKNNEEIENGQ